MTAVTVYTYFGDRSPPYTNSAACHSECWRFITHDIKKPKLSCVVAAHTGLECGRKHFQFQLYSTFWSARASAVVQLEISRPCASQQRRHGHDQVLPFQPSVAQCTTCARSKQAFVIVVINKQVNYDEGNLLIVWETISFWGRTLLHGAGRLVGVTQRTATAMWQKEGPASFTLLSLWLSG